MRRAFRYLRQLAGRFHRLWHDQRRWRRILGASVLPGDGPNVFYGIDQMPSGDSTVTGGLVKFSRLDAVYPNTPLGFNVLYLGSSSRPPDTCQLLWLARRRGAQVVWNQNGVAYPAWAGGASRRINRPLAAGLRAANHVFFQSEFCRLSSERFLGAPAGSWEVLYNAVDVSQFAPGAHSERPLTLLLAGNHYWWYRIETAVRTLTAVARTRPDARLVVAGEIRLLDGSDGVLAATRLANELGVGDRLELLGPYAQTEAPAIMRRGDILVHTQFNDSCPGVVIEALACGLPVVYSASGGTPELVGAEAGIGVSAPLDFERVHPPDPAKLAAAVVSVAERMSDFSEAARARAVEWFDLGPWIERHREVFEELLRS